MVTAETSFVFPLKSFRATYDTIPNAIPSEILNMKGIIMIVKKAGMASVKSSRSISLIGDIMKSPTIINAEAVAAPGINTKNGDRNKARPNITAVDKAVKPVRPPAATPDALSTYVVTVDVPNIAPTVVPIASAKSACFAFGIFPSSPIRPAFVETPTNVPMVSNMSTKRKVKSTTNISNVNTLCHSNWNIIDDISGTLKSILASNIEISVTMRVTSTNWSPCCTISVIGTIIPMTVVERIPMKMAPFTFLASKKPVTIKPIIARRAVPWVTSPIPTRVAGFVTIRPAFLQPIKAIKSPIPTDIACLTFIGILSMMASRTLKNVRIINTIPSKNTAVKANCHEYPIPNTTPNTKNAFNPIPGAKAKGRLAMKAMQRVAINDEMTVAPNTAEKSIPAADRIPGFTAKI